MSEALEIALRHILKVEGDFVDHPADPGGATRFGITHQTLADYIGAPRSQVTVDQVRNLDWQTAREIYRKKYWNLIEGDALPPALAILVMDVAVNSGVRAAIKNLQMALQTQDRSISVDGALGPQTRNAVARFTDTRAKQETIINEFVAFRGRFYGVLERFNVFGLGWARRLVSTARLAYQLWDQEFKLKESEDNTDRTKRVTLERVTRFFLNNGVVQTYGTFFRLWGGWATAAHVYQSMMKTAPEFATGEKIISPGFLDAALFGANLPDTRPAEPAIGQKLLAIGFPAGSSTPTDRDAIVYARRSSESFIAQITRPREPVVVGMSGGIVVDAETAEPVGIIIVRNSPADIDQDGVKDESFDFVALSDLYDAIRSRQA